MTRFALLLCTCIAFSVQDLYSQELFEAHLSGGSKVPAVASTSVGEISARLTGDILEISGSFSGLSTGLTGAGIHLGFAGQNGASVIKIITDLDASQKTGIIDPEKNRVTLSPTRIEALRGRRFYVNITTLGHPDGEIRGQLLPEADRYFEAVMSGGEAVPSAFTEGYGVVVAELRDSLLTVSGAFGGMTTPARSDFLGGTHIHFTRFADSGNTIRFELDVDYDPDEKGGVIRPDSNTFRLDAFQYGLLLDRQWYVDVHSLKFRLAELRGTLHPMSDLYFVGRMTGHNVVPPNESGASVGVVGALRNDTLTLSGTFLPMRGNVDSLGASPAHVHRGRAAENGPIEFPLRVTLQRQNHGHFVPGKNQYVLSGEQIETLLAGNFYADIHSTQYPVHGEVRGQIHLAGNNPAPRAEITSPPSGSSIYVRPGDPVALRAAWNASVDPDGDRVVYVWQLGQNARMTEDSLMLSLSLGPSTSIVLPGVFLDSLLHEIGMRYLETRTIYHRVVTSDGAANDRGPAHPIQVTRTSVSELPQSDPPSADIDGGIIRDLERSIQGGDFREIHSVLLVRDGQIVYESYFKGNADYFDDQLNRVKPGDTLWDATMPHYVAEVTMSVTSMVVGIALDKYGIDVDTPVHTLLPAYSDDFSGSEEEITIRHLLTMTSGYNWDEDEGGNRERMWQSGIDFVEFALQSDHVTKAGDVWRMNSAAVNVLMALVDRLSGDAALFIHRELFDPLDITEFEWRVQPGGPPEAASSLFIRPRDLAKLAYLYLNEGIWNNEQIVPADWVTETLSAQIASPAAAGSGYGYLWWTKTVDFDQNDARRTLQYYTAEGDGGNLVALFPRLDLGLIVTQGNYGEASLSASQNRSILADFLLPATDLRNKPPVVTIESPRDGDRPSTTEPLVIRATADDPDGSVVRMDFLQGSLELASDTVSPFEIQIDSAFSGCYTIAARATDDFGGIGLAYSRIKMGEGCVPGPYGIVPIVVPGVIEAENYDVGGPEVSYVDHDRAENRGGAYRMDEGVDIAGEPGHYYITHTEPGEWLQYFFDVSTGTEYDVIVRTASGSEPGVVRLSVDSLLFTESERLTLEPTDGSWRDTRIASLTLEEGVHRLRFMIEQGGFYLDHIRVVESSVASASEVPPDGGPYDRLVLEIYPNPVNAKATVEFGLPVTGRATLEVFDVVGRRVATHSKRILDRGPYTLALDSSGLPSGMYMLRLSLGPRIVTRKLLVQH